MPRAERRACRYRAKPAIDMLLGGNDLGPGTGIERETHDQRGALLNQRPLIANYGRTAREFIQEGVVDGFVRKRLAENCVVPEYLGRTAQC